MKLHIEVTDLFCGEANYGWVKRYSTAVNEGASDLAIVRAAKKRIGWNGMRCEVDGPQCDYMTIYNRKALQVAFVNFE